MNKTDLTIKILFILLFCFPVLSRAEAPEQLPEETIKESVERPVLGWTERVKLAPEDLVLDAKLTSGVKYNVLYAQDIQQKVVNKKKYVKFTVVDKKGISKELTKEHIKTTLFHTNKGIKERRFKARVGVCIGGVYLDLDFSLTESKNHEHYMKIGRDALAGHFVIDPGNTKITVPDCKIPEESIDES